MMSIKISEEVVSTLGLVYKVRYVVAWKLKLRGGGMISKVRVGGREANSG